MHSENLFKAPRRYFFSSFIKAGTKTTYGLKPIFMANLSAEIMQLVVTFSKVEIYSSLPDMYTHIFLAIFHLVYFYFVVY